MGGRDTPKNIDRILGKFILDSGINGVKKGFRQTDERLPYLAVKVRILSTPDTNLSAEYMY